MQGLAYGLKITLYHSRPRPLHIYMALTNETGTVGVEESRNVRAKLQSPNEQRHSNVIFL